MNLAKVLPLAFVMIAGPQILSAIFLATSEDWRRNSLAFVFGGGLSITIVVSISYALSNGASSGSSPNHTLDLIVLGLLIAASIFTFRRRTNSEPPKWMGSLQTAAPKLSFKLGFLLLGVFPSDLLTSIAVGGFLANHGDPWWHVLPFLAMTLLLLALPALAVLALGKRSQTILPRVRDWMDSHSWIVSEVVIAFFILFTTNSLLD